jgi:hypothetical protein
MAIRVLGATREIPAQVGYFAKAGTARRQFTVSRSDTALGQTSFRPLILCDPAFWNANSYPDIIGAIADANMRDWTATSANGALTTGATGIPSGTWTNLRQVAVGFGNTEMIGLMLVMLRYGGFIDFLVSAAPNMLFVNNPQATANQNRGNTGAPTIAGTWNSHGGGDNNGTQVHAEMVLAGQLLAFHSAMTTVRSQPIEPSLAAVVAKPGLQTMVTPPQPAVRGRNAPPPLPAEEVMTIDVDLFIEKGSLCPGCFGTWQAVFTQPPPTNPKVRVSYRI